MNILYLGCHSILEYDELKLFEELGHDYFSIGAYINPQHPHDPKRPPLNGKYHEQLAAVAQVHNSYNLHDEQVEWADIVICMHIPEFVSSNWPIFKKHNKRVVWRTIGQSIEEVEAKIKPFRDDGLEVVRYSPTETRIPSYVGEDAVIRFYKDPDEFKAWDRQTDEVVTFAQSMRSRGAFCNFDLFKAATEGLNAHVYGPNNDDAGELNGGSLSYDDLKAKMRHSAAYFYTGTHPASYTLNFIEAWMTGIPIIAIGPQHGNSNDFNQNTYEVPELIKNGLFGYVSDDVDQLKIFLENTISDEQHAKEVSRQARNKAIELFGKQAIKKKWKAFLGGQYGA